MTTIEKPIFDFFGNQINPGDIVTYISSSSRKSPYLNCGVFIDTFENGSGWKMRIRYPEPSRVNGCGDNALIDKGGFALGVIKLRKDDPKIRTEIREAFRLRDDLIASNKIKNFPKPRDTMVDIFVSLDSLGTPKSLR